MSISTETKLGKIAIERDILDALSVLSDAALKIGNSGLAEEILGAAKRGSRLAVIHESDEPLYGTVFKGPGVIRNKKLVLEALSLGGKLRGMFLGVEAGDFELLTVVQVKREERLKLISFGQGTRVAGSVVKELCDDGLIEVPASKGSGQKIAVAHLVDKASALSAA